MDELPGHHGTSGKRSGNFERALPVEVELVIYPLCRRHPNSTKASEFPAVMISIRESSFQNYMSMILLTWNLEFNLVQSNHGRDLNGGATN